MKYAALLTLSAALSVPPHIAAQTSPSPDRPVSWKLLVPNLLHDQAHIWSFPAALAHGHHWLPTVTILGACAGLIILDPTEGSWFRRTGAFQPLNNVFTGRAALAGIVAAPLSLYGSGLVRRDSRMVHTALLAGQAVAGAEFLTTAIKDATRRVRPAGFPPSADFHDSWFESPGSYLRGRGSFPSGHTIAAFSVATVVARRYDKHRWIPVAAYGLAAAVGFSRLTLSAHFLSDVFMGGALGYSISRFVVLRQ